MEAMTAPVLPYSGPFTADDLELMPDGGNRYELIDGALIVTPAPQFGHQLSSSRLLILLAQAAPSDMTVLCAPFEIRLADDTAVQPDLLVALRERFTVKNLPEAPLLAVEILSPSTALIDMNLKKARFEIAGVRSYWILDPRVPRLQAFELRDGVYALIADVSGDESWTATVPFEVTIIPACLLD